jgi:hypothetical protein
VRAWGIAEDQVNVASFAGLVEVAFSPAEWPPEPVVAGPVHAAAAAWMRGRASYVIMRRHRLMTQLGDRRSASCTR